MNITYEEALAVCVQYYVDRGNTEEQARVIVSRGEAAVFWLYEEIQKEKELPQNVTTIVSLTQFVRGESAKTEAADE